MKFRALRIGEGVDPCFNIWKDDNTYVGTVWTTKDGIKIALANGQPTELTDDMMQYWLKLKIKNV